LRVGKVPPDAMRNSLDAKQARSATERSLTIRTNPIACTSTHPIRVRDRFWWNHAMSVLPPQYIGGQRFKRDANR
jgi:hypothetical protein